MVLTEESIDLENIVTGGSDLRVMKELVTVKEEEEDKREKRKNVGVVV